MQKKSTNCLVCISVLMLEKECVNKRNQKKRLHLFFFVFNLNAGGEENKLKREFFFAQIAFF